MLRVSLYDMQAIVEPIEAQRIGIERQAADCAQNIRVTIAGQGHGFRDAELERRGVQLIRPARECSHLSVKV